MYQVIKNEEQLNEWLKVLPNEVSVINTHTGVLRALNEVVSRLDACYGANRDLRADLGGYTILLFGGAEIESHFNKIMEYHKLNAEEYEYEDKYIEPERSIEVTFRLYLCSSDYAVVIITITEGRDING